MQIRRATLTDIDGINKLLYEVHKVHSDKRPDLFKVGSKKCTNEELAKIIVDDNRPIFVYVDNDDILGYAFCVFIKNNSNSLTDILTLYIDDLCVDKMQGVKKLEHHYIIMFYNSQKMLVVIM